MKTDAKYYSLFSRENRTALCLAAVPVVVNSLLLIRLGAGLVLQTYSLAAAALMTICGLVLLGEKGKRIPDTIMRFVAGFLIGMITFTALNFIILHINNPNLTRAVNALFFLSFLILGITRRKQLFPPLPRVTVSGANIVWIIFLSLFLSFTTAYGFLNNPRGRASRKHMKSWSFIFKPGDNIPNWGWNKDKRWYLYKSPVTLQDQGLPEERLQHTGPQVFWLTLTALTPDFSVEKMVKIYKILSLILFFCLLYSFAFIADHFFGLGTVPTAVTVFAVPFFSAINYPLFTLGRSSYAGFFTAGPTTYHSLTQLMGIIIGVAGIIMFLLAVAEGRPTFSPGCLLITGAFFFKPTVFSLLAPVIFILFFLYRRVPLPDRVLGLCLLLIPPLFWHFYAAGYNIPVVKPPIAFQPFTLLFHYASRHFPPSITARPLLMGTLIVLFSFAVLIPILLDRIISRSPSRGKALGGMIERAQNHIPEIFFTIILVIGVLSYALLIEDGPRMVHGNFCWGAATGYLLFIPFLVKLIFGIRNIFLRVGAFSLFTLHLWGGIYHLYRFTIRGKII